MESSIHKRITSFLDDYAPHPSYPFIKVDYEAWAHHLYGELKTLKNTHEHEDRSDEEVELGWILNNVVFAMTSEAVDGTSMYQMMQDDVRNSEAFEEICEIYQLI